MSVGKFNELGNAAMARVNLGGALTDADSKNANSARPGDNSTVSPGSEPGNNAGRRAGAPLGAGVDWFSQLASGTAHPMKASNQFGKNPPIDTIVDSILSELGLHSGSG